MDTEILTGITWYVEQTRHDLLTADEEVALGARVRAGDEEAQRELVTANLRLAVSIAKGYAGRGVPLEDLVQFANLGLMRAARLFDERKGYRFSTYATYWCRQSCQRACTDIGRIIRLPVHMDERIGVMNRAVAYLAARLNRAPSDDELAAELGWTVAKVEATKLFVLRGQVVSLDEPLSEPGDDTWITFVADMEADTAETAETAVRSGEIRALLRWLNPRARQVLELRFGLGEDGRCHTLEEVGNKLGCTRERARQLEQQALKLLRPFAERLRDEAA